MKRLCIYLTYDKQNVIDKYIDYMLKELKTCADYLAVTCNEEVVVRGMDILEESADEIFLRPNIGFDAGGFKDTLCKYLGWDKVLQYDELVLVNDSMFGPFCPMKDIFAEMNQRSVDFWGLAIHGEGKNSFVGYIHEHIQSYFLVIGSSMLHSPEFKDYWNSMPYFTSIRETIMDYEIEFTRYFSGLGYTYSALADTKVNDSANYMYNYSQYALISYEMLKKRNFPFLKRLPLSVNTLYCQTQQNLRQSIDYIDKETDYDVNLIWDNIIRIYHMADLQQTLHLQYIISGEQKKNLSGSVAVAVFLSHGESAEYVLEYLSKLNPAYSIILLAEDAGCLEDYRGYDFLCREAGGDAFTELLWELRKYDFICVLHDTEMTSKTDFSCVGKSYFYNVWENLLKDAAHVAGILDCFAKEPRLGLLAPPQPNFGNYFGEYGEGFGKNFKNVWRIAKELELNCQISEVKPPFRVTDNFWARGSVLERLKEIKKTDIPVLPYIWSFLAQDAGYYSGIIETAEYASMNEVNLQYYLQKLAGHVRGQCGNFLNYGEMLEQIRICTLRGFCAKYERLMVYGAGEEARARKGLLPEIEAYIVSDGQEKPQDIDGVAVKHLSEAEVSDDCGIVLCLNKINQMQVIPLLEAKGIENYFCV